MIKEDEIFSLQQGHRARLRKKFLDGQLAEYEIIELLLTYAIPRRDVRNLSRQLYKKYGGLHQLLSASYESLMENDGIKENTATFFKVIHKLMEIDCKFRLNEKPIFYEYPRLERYCKLILGGKPIEEFHVLYMDSQFRLIEDQLHSSGTIDWAAVYVREIVKKALDLNASNIVLLHNHPSQITSFSSEDILITDELAAALENLKIKLYDHLLVSGDIVYSARNMRFLDKYEKRNK